MKTETHKQVQISLLLNEEEAKWLMLYMQNAKTSLDEESDYDGKMRMFLFTVLKEGLMR